MSELTGRVVGPDDVAYADARSGWNRLFEHRPAVVVFAQETTDVVNAVRYAQLRGVPIRVRSGRHCLEGWNAVDDGLVVDVSEMKSAAIDCERLTATVGAGLTQLEAVRALGAAGVATPTGTEGTVGLVGATLGGGFGLLTRRYGMASDNLLAAEIVVATAGCGAEAITVDAEHHADLLWALRGAGNGNFGVVTSLTYRIHPLTHTVYLVATWRGLDRLPELFDAWQRTAPFAGDRITSQLEICSDRIGLTAVLTEGSEADARLLLEPMLTIGEPDVVVTERSWADTYAGFQIPIDDEPANWKFTSQFMTEPFPPEAIEIIATFLRAAPTPACNYFTNALRGAVLTAEPAGGSAYAHRDALFYAEPGAGWGDRGAKPPADEALSARCLAWIADFSAALGPYANGGYVNVPNAGTADWASEYWRDNVPGLRAVKAAYDPSDVFTFEQGITPAAAT